MNQNDDPQTSHVSKNVFLCHCSGINFQTLLFVSLVTYYFNRHHTMTENGFVNGIHASTYTQL